MSTKKPGEHYFAMDFVQKLAMLLSNFTSNGLQLSKTFSHAFLMFDMLFRFASSLFRIQSGDLILFNKCLMVEVQVLMFFYVVRS